MAAPPKYSIAFLAPSGGAPGQGFWGSRYYWYSIKYSLSTCIPILTLTLDPSGGVTVTGDTVVFAGLDDVELDPASRPAWVAALHPELGLTVANGGTTAQSHLEASVFSRSAIPSLSVVGGRAVDDLAWMPRVLRLVFYLGQGIADTAKRPRLSTAGRQEVFAEP